MARTGRTRRLLIGGIGIVVLALCGFFLRGVRTPKQDVNEVHVSAGFEYIAAPELKWRQFEGITPRLCGGEQHARISSPERR